MSKIMAWIKKIISIVPVVINAVKKISGIVKTTKKNKLKKGKKKNA